MDSTALILLPFALFFMRVIGEGNTRTFTKPNGQKSQFVAFDSKGGDIEVSILSKLTAWKSLERVCRRLLIPRELIPLIERVLFDHF